MKIDFHYYLVYILTEGSGFDRDVREKETEADILAYASQSVDDNDDRRIIDEEDAELPEFEDGMADDERAAVEMRASQRFP